MIFIQSAAQVNTAKPFVKVDGGVVKSLMLTPGDLAKMNRSTVTIKDHEGKEQSYTGVTIQEILEMAGVTMGHQLRKENLSKYLMVKCADGYKVLFSLPELDSSFTDKAIILADTSMVGPCPMISGLFALLFPTKRKVQEVVSKCRNYW